MLVTVAVRGGLQPIPIGVGHCSISGNPYVNGFCLNPLYSVLATTIGPADSRYSFSDEEINTHRVRTLLDSAAAEPALPQYPMLRESAGVEGGNRKNVVMIILESWTGKDVAGLGGDPAITPAWPRMGCYLPISRRPAFAPPKGYSPSSMPFPTSPTVRCWRGRSHSRYVGARSVKSSAKQVTRPCSSTAATWTSTTWGRSSRELAFTMYSIGMTSRRRFRAKKAVGWDITTNRSCASQMTGSVPIASRSRL